MERRFLNNAEAKVALVERESGKPPLITGYASVFYDGTPASEYVLWEGAAERILAGAFDRALAEGDDTRGLFNHDPSQLLGRTKSGTMRLSIDQHGLRYEIDAADTTVGRDVVTHLRRGDVTGSSFAFIVTDEQWKKEGGKRIREIKGVKLFDVSPCVYPAYESTSAGVRGASAADAGDARASLEKWEAESLRSVHSRYAAIARAREVEANA